MASTVYEREMRLACAPTWACSQASRLIEIAVQLGDEVLSRLVEVWDRVPWRWGRQTRQLSIDVIRGNKVLLPSCNKTINLSVECITERVISSLQKNSVAKYFLSDGKAGG